MDTIRLPVCIRCCAEKTFGAYAHDVGSFEWFSVVMPHPIGLNEQIAGFHDHRLAVGSRVRAPALYDKAQGGVGVTMGRGCFAEVLKGRSDFKFVDGPRGQSLLYRGSHVMSTPTGQDNLAARLASMDDAGIGLAVLSVGALNIGWAGAREVSAARVINDGLAAVCRQHPSRFRFVAVLPCTNYGEMVTELDRAQGLGTAGVGIATIHDALTFCA